VSANSRSQKDAAKAERFMPNDVNRRIKCNNNLTVILTKNS